MKEIIAEIVILAEELAKELEHPDMVARLYTVQRKIDVAIGVRMMEMRDSERTR